MMIFVGSTNPVKINSVQFAASETWPEVRVQGMDVPSGVNAQPRTDAETKLGAENRAKAAFDDGLLTLSERDISAYKQGKIEILGVGLEGGIMMENSQMWSTVWACVFRPEDGVFFSNGARFQVPDLIAQPILRGEEMGEVAKRLMGGIEVKQLNGVIGMVTNNFIDRTEEYAGIVKMALGLWYGRNWAVNLHE